MSSDKIKMSFSQNHLRVRLTFRASYCAEVHEPPLPIIRRAENKLSKELDLGNLHLYEIFDEGLNRLWKNVRAEISKPGAQDLWVTYTIGSGSPRINEILVEPSDSDKVAFYLTFRGQPTFANNWAFDFIGINIRQQLRQLGISADPNDAHLFSCWLRAKRGEIIKRSPIGKRPLPGESKNDEGFSVIGSKARSEVNVIISDHKVFHDTQAMQVLVSSAAKAVAKLQAVTGTPLEFLKDRLIDRLKSALRGPERYGIGLPVCYLVGYPALAATANEPQISFESARESDPRTGAPPLNSEAKAEPAQKRVPFTVNVSDDAMMATIENFDKTLYDHGSIAVDADLIENEVKAAGIKNGFTEEIRQHVTGVIAKGASLDGVIVAEGQLPVEPEGPYLYEVYKDVNPDEQYEGADLREMQQRSLVDEGDLVAEVRYEVAPVNGKNVYGVIVSPADAEKLDISIGEGIEVRDDGKYYAMYNGVPEVTENSLELKRVLIHQGDVNLRSGNIRFDGPVEIKGSIDTGATVEVTGDLLVHGTISEANVRVGGNLEVKAGIVTGRRGLVRVRNDLLAEFVDNARIICGGDIKVKKGILNSNLVAGGSIQVDRRLGVIAGGRISCRQHIRTAKLGFPKGSGTKVFCGVDWRAKVAVEIRENRLESVIDANANDRNELRELTRKKHKTQKHIELIESLQKRLQKTRPLIEKLRAYLAKAEGEMTFDPDARIYVHDTLYPNVEIEVGGVAVPVKGEVAEVEIRPKRQRGSHIVALTDDQLNPPKAG